MSAIEQRASIQQLGVMNPNPFEVCQKSDWKRRISSLDALNCLNPIDHPWYFDSSTVAKRRVRDVVWADRSRCGDGKWVACPSVELVGIDQWGRFLFKTAGKPRYRWEARQ